jgi:alpha,alpha-trehalase
MQEYKSCLNFINSYWNEIIIKPTHFRVGNKMIRKVILKSPKNYNILEVPFACIVPNASKYRYIFYWDSYFMFRGVLGTKNEWIIPEMVENFIYIFNKYQIIPNFTHPESLGRSQAPFLTSMIFDAYAIIKRNRTVSARLRDLLTTHKQWLTSRIATAKREYEIVWESPIGIEGKSYNHKVTEYGLNRYGDRDVGYGHNAEKESGWDMTSRFYDRCDDFLPVDLNCFLYKYEKDFAKAAKIVGKGNEQKTWEKKAEKRKALINTYMWNEKKGFFYDYDYVHKKQSIFLSLAGFVPMWMGLATYEQAKKMVLKLPSFHTKFGLAITDKESLPPPIDLTHVAEPYRITLEEVLKQKQWDYPNIWPPLHYIVCIGLLRYGFIDEAKKLMQEFLEANNNAFDKHNKLPEKMDGATGDLPPTYWYPTQLGFGWTNAVFYRYTQILTSLEQVGTIYVLPQPPTPPYELAITH